MLIFTIFLLTFLKIHCEEPQVLKVENPNNITIAFGSCVNTFDEDEDIKQIFGSIVNTQPDIWVWLGDSVYLDGEAFFFGSLPGPGYDISDEQYVKDTFSSLKEKEAYAALLDTCQVIGTWDDHDYAYDSANKTFEYKERNMKIYLDFLDEPSDSSRRNQSGVYTSYYIGEDKLIKIILLDIRYNRDDESTAANFADTDTTETFDDMLGDEQWDWLDKQLEDNTANYTIIASGTQFLPDNRPVLPNWFVNSRERLLDLLNSRQKSGVILLSGDVHFAEMITYPCPSRVGYQNFYEFTSSGMTHSASFVDVFDGVTSETYNTEDDRYFGHNFGILKFSRDENSEDVPNLVFEARDEDGNVVLTKEVKYSDLVYNETLANSYSGCEAIDSDDEGESGEGGGEDLLDGDAGENIVDQGQDLIDDTQDEVVNEGQDILNNLGL